MSTHLPEVFLDRLLVVRQLDHLLGEALLLVERHGAGELAPQLLHVVLQVPRLAARLHAVVVDGLVLVVDALLAAQQLRFQLVALLLRVGELAQRDALGHLQLHDVTMQLADDRLLVALRLEVQQLLPQ